MRDDIKESLDLYGEAGRETGGFLRAVLENDLLAAVSKADDDNQRDLKEIVLYVFNKLPEKCWGSFDAVNDWLEMWSKHRAAIASPTAAERAAYREDDS